MSTTRMIEMLQIPMFEVRCGNTDDGWVAAECQCPTCGEKTYVDLPDMSGEEYDECDPDVYCAEGECDCFPHGFFVRLKVDE